MKLDFTAQRMLAVVAHPDDVELLCAGTLARAMADGAVIGMCSICRGEKGGAGDARRDLAAQRKQEFSQAAKVLDAAPFFADVPDGTLTDSEANRRKLIQIYRRFRPTIVLAHSPDDYHADHRAAAALAESASWFACSAGHRTRQKPLAEPPAVLWMDTINMLGFEPGFYIDISDYLAIKEQMLRCHQSQLQRGSDSDFEPLLDMMIRQATARGAQAGVAAAEAYRIHPAWKRVRAW